MNEDDTFSRLRRIPYNEMKTKVIAFNMENVIKKNSDRSGLYPLMEEHGWNLADYHFQWKNKHYD